ncbi:hypothetical protein CSHISOI_09158 [Colletotrichum shisoi]|uniref:Uncharacterized protein n=1 Tax=Colletotrichum shisoi TaxID=2078593 RepID=A0A5Q4BI89_9PEZI|nr:hypothetical protein CSHISOI_09158 [Colletotrichum shisoi]
MRLSGPIGLAVALAAAGAQACLEINVDNGGQAVCETDNCDYLNTVRSGLQGGEGDVNNAYVVNMEKLY